MVRVKRCVGLSAGVLMVAGLVAGCGGDGGSKSGGSFANIQSSISSPTGTVSETTAADIGEAFEEISAGGAPAFGMRRDAVGQTQSSEIPCGSSGSISVTGSSGSSSSGSGRVNFNNCCETAGCCMNGGANVYYSTSGGAPAEDGSNVSYCAEYDVQYSCEGQNASIDYAGCFSASGWVYVLEVDGESYAVSGSYSGGSGTLTITGENGTWTCTYSGGSGSCSGEGETFTF